MSETMNEKGKWNWNENDVKANNSRRRRRHRPIATAYMMNAVIVFTKIWITRN